MRSKIAGVLNTPRLVFNHDFAGLVGCKYGGYAWVAVRTTQALLNHDHLIATDCDMFFVRDKHEHPYGVGATCPIPAIPSNIEIFHPGFDKEIFVFPRFDSIPGPEPEQLQYGFHYGTMMMICFIITGNSHGFLSPVRLAGSGLVPATPPANTVQEFDSLLTAPTYYYYIRKLYSLGS